MKELMYEIDQDVNLMMIQMNEEEIKHSNESLQEQN
jgi:hypothetical protein